MALVIGMPLALATGAAAQSSPTGPSGPSAPSSTSTTCPDGASGPSGASGPESCPSTTTTARVVATTSSVSGSGLARTGGEAALPLVASAAAIAVVLGGRRLASHLHG
jgi:hypothetical protein